MVTSTARCLFSTSLTWVFELLRHGAEGGHFLLLGGVQHHHCGAQQAEEAAHLAVHIQTLIQEVRRQHGAAKKHGGRL